MADDPICGIRPSEMREHLETDLGDEAIGRLMEDACAAIASRIGSVDEQTIIIDVRGSDRYVFLPHPVADADSISEVIERIGTFETELETTDWRLTGSRTLERVLGPSLLDPTVWGWNFVSGDTQFQLVITYTPKPDSRKVRVMVDLIKLAIQYTALKSETAGDYASTGLDYQGERAKLISELVRPTGFA